MPPKKSGSGASEEAKKHAGEGIERLEKTGEQMTESLKRGAENVHKKVDELMHKGKKEGSSSSK